MTAALLRDALIRELTDLFKDRLYDSTRGPVPIAVYPQWTPIRDSYDPADLVPYIVVRVTGGTVKSPQDPHNVRVEFHVAAYDNADENRGFRTVEEVIHEIAFHFAQNPLFGGGRFRFVYPFEWVNQDEESYPYFFGGATCTFQVTPPIYTKASDLT